MSSSQGGEGPFGPSHSLVFLLSKVGYAASRSFAAALAPIGLEPRHFALLNHVALGEGQTQQALGLALDIPPSRVVAIVDDLEGRGYVERRAHPTDRRARALYLTTDGEALLRKAREVARAHEVDFCRDIDPASRARLIALLSPLAALQDLPPGVHPALADTEPSQSPSST